MRSGGGLRVVSGRLILATMYGVARIAKQIRAGYTMIIRYVIVKPCSDMLPLPSIYVFMMITSHLCVRVITS